MGQAKQRGSLEDRIKQVKMAVCIHEAGHAFFYYAAAGKECIDIATTDMTQIAREEFGISPSMANSFSKAANGAVVVKRKEFYRKASDNELAIAMFGGAAAEIAILKVKREDAYKHGVYDFLQTNVRKEFSRDFCDAVAETLSKKPKQIAIIKKIAESLFEKTTITGEEIGEIIEQSK